MPRQWPEWWWWELQPTPHLFKWMLDRAFSETDLRALMEVATGYRPSEAEGRYVMETTHDGKSWK